MPFVCIDSNVIDLFLDASIPEAADSMESQEAPPPYQHPDPTYRREILACYWLMAMASDWRGVLYTFSDELYREVGQAGMTKVASLLGLALEIREHHPLEARMVDANRRPTDTELTALGLKAKDARHVADAIGMGCDTFLSNDRRLRNKSSLTEQQWGIRCRRPSEFLVEAAPWTTRAPWPWEALAAA